MFWLGGKSPSSLFLINIYLKTNKSDKTCSLPKKTLKKRMKRCSHFFKCLLAFCCAFGKTDGEKTSNLLLLPKYGTKKSCSKMPNLSTRKQNSCFCLTFRLPSTTIVPSANSLDPDETLSNSASHPDPSCLTLRQHFHQLWARFKHF